MVYSKLNQTNYNYGFHIYLCQKIAKTQQVLLIKFSHKIWGFEILYLRNNDKFVEKFEISLTNLYNLFCYRQKLFATNSHMVIHYIADPSLFKMFTWIVVN